jgi:uncharacterized membrane protein
MKSISDKSMMGTLRTINIFFFIFFFSYIFFSCYKKADLTAPRSGTVPAGVTEKNVTYNNYVYTLLKNNCSTCHGVGGSAQVYWFNLNTHSDAVQWGKRITKTIVENSMPPLPRTPFSKEEKFLLEAWVKRGLPQ